MQLTENARVVLEKRYLMRDEHGKTIETVDGLFERVAQAVAKPELSYGGKSRLSLPKKTSFSQ